MTSIRLRMVLWTLVTACIFAADADGQIVTRQRPGEWNDLVLGGRFMDRFLPMPVQGPLTGETWGADNVIPRYVDNGLEDNEWSYWGGNALLGDDGRYHLFVCRWREDSVRSGVTYDATVVIQPQGQDSVTLQTSIKL